MTSHDALGNATGRLAQCAFLHKRKYLPALRNKRKRLLTHNERSSGVQLYRVIHTWYCIGTVNDCTTAERPGASQLWAYFHVY